LETKVVKVKLIVQRTAWTSKFDCYWIRQNEEKIWLAYSTSLIFLGTQGLLNDL